MTFWSRKRRWEACLHTRHCKILDGGLQIQLDENVNNNVDIRFDVSVWSGPDSAYLSTEEIVVNVKNRILLSGLMSDRLMMERARNT